MKSYSYISIDEILSRVLRHPLMQDVTREQAIQYVIDFMSLFGCPSMFLDKEVEVQINNYMGELPCDMVSVNQVRDSHGVCLRAMTSTFLTDPHDKDPYPDKFPDRVPPLKVKYDNLGNPIDVYVEDKKSIYSDKPHGHYEGEPYHNLRQRKEGTFRIQGNIIFVSFPNGKLDVSYKSIPVDENGFPMLIDNPVFLATLELYIKKQVFTVLFDIGTIQKNVLDNTLQEYAFKAGQCRSEFVIPDVSEMQSIMNMWCSLIQKSSEFYSGFKHLGDRERYLKH